LHLISLFRAYTAWINSKQRSLFALCTAVGMVVVVGVGVVGRDKRKNITEFTRHCY